MKKRQWRRCPPVAPSPTRLIVRHRGRIANTARDSVLAEFVSVLDAVGCAVEIQEALERANETEPGARRLRFQIGINVGDVMVKDGDIFGDGVNVAARLEGLVRGGEICVSRGVYDHLHHRSGMIFEDLGEQLVKNIAPDQGVSAPRQRRYIRARSLNRRRYSRDSRRGFRAGGELRTVRRQ
jgi:class 3 adenylate cyclase